jgi:hypothetical protein
MGDHPRKADGRRVFSTEFKRTQIQRVLTGEKRPGVQGLTKRPTIPRARRIVPGASHVLPSRTERAALYRPADKLLPEKVARLLAHVAQMPVPRSRRIPGYTPHPQGLRGHRASVDGAR